MAAGDGHSAADPRDAPAAGPALSGDAAGGFAPAGVAPAAAGPGGNRPPALVRLPAHLTVLFPGAPRCLELEAATVDEMMDRLNARWPGMRDRLCDSTPAVRRHINVFVGGRRARLDTALPAGADVFIITAISGG